MIIFCDTLGFDKHDEMSFPLIFLIVILFTWVASVRTRMEACQWILAMPNGRLRGIAVWMWLGRGPGEEVRRNISTCSHAHIHLKALEGAASSVSVAV